jgi:hypothetical protein
LVRCNSISNSSQCEFNSLYPKISNLNCIWVENEVPEIAKCQEIKDDCSKIETEATCKQEGSAFSSSLNNNLSCIWITESESDDDGNGKNETGCQEVKDNCEYILTSAACMVEGAAGDRTCIWISEKEDENLNSCKNMVCLYLYICMYIHICIYYIFIYLSVYIYLYSYLYLFMVYSYS